jgi:myo-inositol-1(or 4)-monophosphatase
MNSETIKNVELLATLDKIKVEICHFIDENLNKSGHLEISEKSDKSLVTNVDIFISNLIKEKVIGKYPFLNFYSEEDMENFDFPMIILDPIDGTKELASGVGECVVSFGVYFSPNFDDKRNFSWIFNPFNGFSISSLDPYITSKRIFGEKLLAYISRTEASKGLFKADETFQYHAVGSIAYKLGLLAAGSCDFVISRRPKNIWDIMAGSHICHLRGMRMTSKNDVITSISTKLLQDTLMWYPLEIEEKVKKLV